MHTHTHCWLITLVTVSLALLAFPELIRYHTRKTLKVRVWLQIKVPSMWTLLHSFGRFTHTVHIYSGFHVILLRQRVLKLFSGPALYCRCCGTVCTRIYIFTLGLFPVDDKLRLPQCTRSCSSVKTVPVQ